MATLNVGQFKDLLQELLGTVELSLEMTNFLLNSGRREVEKRVNAYWMTQTTNFQLTPGVNEYTITSGTPINRPNFKEIFFLSYREFGTSKWNHLPHRAYQLLNNQYDPADAGPPKEAAIDNITLFIFPNPDKDYQIRMHAFEWQDNPADNVSAGDDLMDRFPEALLYGATMVGTQLLTKDQTLAKPWSDLLQTQIPAIQAYSDARIKRPNV